MKRLQALRKMGLLAMTNEGGDGGGGDAAAVAAASAAATAAPSPADIAARAASAAATPAADAADDAEPWADPAKARAEIERLRRERGDERIAAKTKAADDARAEVLAKIMKTLDPDAKDGDVKTPEQLMSMLDAAKGEGSAAKIDAALTEQAWATGVDPKRADYLRFILGKRPDFAALDVADATLGATLGVMISEEIAKDPSLKAPGVAQSTTDTQFGGAGGASTYTLAEFKAMPITARTALFQSNRAEYDRLVALK